MFPQVEPLLNQVPASVASFTGDGAYDQDSVYAGVAERHPEAAVIVPPRSTAVPSKTAETAPISATAIFSTSNQEASRARRDGVGRTVSWFDQARRTSPSTDAGRGRRRPDTRSGPEPRLPSAGSSRWSGTGCARARISAGRPRWPGPSTCSTACWIWDARTTSASSDPGRGWGQCAQLPDTKSL